MYDNNKIMMINNKCCTGFFEFDIIYKHNIIYRRHIYIYIHESQKRYSNVGIGKNYNPIK